MTNEEVSEWLDYDPNTGIMTWKKSSKFRPNLKGSIAGSINAYGYHCIMINKRTYKRSRLAFLLMTGRWPDGEIDHINQVRNDDRWCNLRDATSRENIANRTNTGVNNECSRIGVSVNSDHRRKGVGKPYRAQIHHNGKKIHIGLFDTIEEAGEAYDAKLMELENASK